MKLFTCWSFDKSNDGKDYDSVSCSFQYPTDLAKIPKSVHDVREFAFADLHQIGTSGSRSESTLSETYSFMIGREFHGICVVVTVAFIAGHGYEINSCKVRCFVIVSRHPFHHFFQCILHQVRGMTFLCEDRDQSIRDLLTKLSEQKTSDSLRTPSTHLKIPDFVKRDLRNYRDLFL